MKVLFVSSSAPDGGPKAVAGNQAASLADAGVAVSHFLITRKGLCGYLRTLPALSRAIRREAPAVVHAHYLWSGLAAALAGARPLLVSLMGSEIHGSRALRLIIRLAAGRLWQHTIVKSAAMAAVPRHGAVTVLPNGVNTRLFRPLARDESIAMTGFDSRCFNIIFVGDPSRPEKNHSLAAAAVALLGDDGVRLITLHGINPATMPWYYNAADMLLLTSLWEGSPNCVKEAMACNLPVVATPVGDVAELTGGVDGCLICGFTPPEVAACIRQIMNRGGRTAARDRIMERGLDAAGTAARLTAIYEEMTVYGS